MSRFTLGPRTYAESEAAALAREHRDNGKGPVESCGEFVRDEFGWWREVERVVEVEGKEAA